MSIDDSKKGFIKIDRAMLEWEWYDHVPTKVLWLHLLLKANWKPSRYRGHEIPAGSLVTGVNGLAEQTGLSVQQVRTAINNLKHNEITIKSTNKFSIISIVKWSKYQGNNNQATNKKQTNDSGSLTPATTSKEPKNQELNIYISRVSEKVWRDYTKLRKEKKSSITETALQGIDREATKAGVTFEEALRTCCERGWVGFKAKWIEEKKEKKQNGYSKKTRTQDLAEQASRMLDELGQGGTC